MANIFASIETFAASEQGAVLTSALLPVVEQKALSSAESLVTGFVAQAKKDDPAASAAQVAETVDGDVWHYCRGKLGFLGFLVDVARNNPDVDGRVRVVIAAALPDPSASGGLVK